VRRLRLLTFGIAAWALLVGCSLLVDTTGLTGPNGLRSEAGPGDGSIANEEAGPRDASDDRTVRDAAAEVDCPPAPNDPSLAAWFPFEESTGDVLLDCSGHVLDAELVPSGTFLRVAGRVGRGVDLVGDGACFDLGLAPALAFGTAPFTVTAWIKPRRFSRAALPDSGNNPTPQWFFGHVGTSTGVTRGWGIGTDDVNEIEFKGFHDDGVYAEAVTLVNTPDWLHVAGVHQDGQLLRALTATEIAALAQ
jgi:hypothetical protein